MKITDIFKNNSNEKKLVNKLMEMKRSEIDNDMRDFAAFERMRQTWIKPGDTEQASNQIYYKIFKKGEYVTQQNIDDIEKDPKFADIKDTKEFKRYLDYLNQLLKENRLGENNDLDKYKTQFDNFVHFGTNFIDGFKVYKNDLEFVLKNNWVVTKKEQEGICDIITKVQLKLNNIGGSLEELKKILSKDNLESEKGKTYYLKLAQEVQGFMYGKNNFYQKYAQKVFNKYKDVYKMILDCKKDKLQNYVENLGLDEMVKSKICTVLDALACMSKECHGENNKYLKKAWDIEKIFIP